MGSEQTRTTSTTRSKLADLPWLLIVTLGAIGVTRPILSILGISSGRAWLSILATIVVMMIWIGVVLAKEISNSFLTLVAVGGMYGILSMVLNIMIQGDLSRQSAQAIVSFLVTNMICVAVCGTIATAIR